jgi:hypothetical protein
MMAGTELTVNSVAYKEEEEEWYVSLAKSENWQGSEDSWRMPNDSWLKMEGEDEVTQVYHVHIIWEEDDNEEEMGEVPTEEERGLEEDNKEEEPEVMPSEGEGQGSEEKMRCTERKRGLERSWHQNKKRRPKRKKICKEDIDWEKIKLDTEIGTYFQVIAVKMTWSARWRRMKKKRLVRVRLG